MLTHAEKFTYFVQNSDGVDNVVFKSYDEELVAWEDAEPVSQEGGVHPSLHGQLHINGIN